MYIDKGGKEWSSEDSYKEYSYITGALLDYQLAIEDYTDDVGNDEVFLTEHFKRLWAFRENRELMNEQQLLKEIKDIFQGIKEIIEIIGKEKFIFYDDGGVEYIWQNLNKSK